MASVLSYFRLQRNERVKREQEPKTISIWIKHGLSEFFGTFILALSLAGLSISAGDGKIAEHYFLHPIIVSFYAGFIAVGFVLLVFLRWSADLNPAVTITRILRGKNTLRYGIYKISIQMIAALATGIAIYGLGKINGEVNSNGTQISNFAIDAIKADKTSYLANISDYKSSVIGGSIWILISEVILTSALLFPIFSKRISDKYRDVLIMFIISLVVAFAILNKTAALNPARGFSQQVPGLIWGPEVSGSTSYSSLVGATFAMLAGTFFAPFFYVFMQGVTDKFNNIFTLSVRFKNYRTDNMKRDNQVEDKTKYR